MFLMLSFLNSYEVIGPDWREATSQCGGKECSDQNSKVHDRRRVFEQAFSEGPFRK